MCTTGGEPFTAQAIISNPPVYSHLHVAEKMGIPVNLRMIRSCCLPQPDCLAIPASRSSSQQQQQQTILCTRLVWLMSGHHAAGLVAKQIQS